MENEKEDKKKQLTPMLQFRNIIENIVKTNKELNIPSLTLEDLLKQDKVWEEVLKAEKAFCNIFWIRAKTEVEKFEDLYRKFEPNKYKEE